MYSNGLQWSLAQTGLANVVITDRCCGHCERVEMAVHCSTII